MKRMPGPTTVYYLVALSLFNGSSGSAKRRANAIGAERADAARPLFIQALKSRDINLTSLAAQGISAVGDPHGDAVAYLIDSLVFQDNRAVALTQPQVLNAYWRTKDLVWIDHHISATRCSLTRAWS